MTLAIEWRVDLIIAMMIPGMKARRIKIGNRDEKITIQRFAVGSLRSFAFRISSYRRTT
jgi:hypothetical protein